MTTATRQTAGNNAFLAAVKLAMNGPIFKEASALLNADGEAAARAYVGQYFDGDVDAGLERVGRDVLVARSRAAVK